LFDQKQNANGLTGICFTRVVRKNFAHTENSFLPKFSLLTFSANFDNFVCFPQKVHFWTLEISKNQFFEDCNAKIVLGK
jgi:hypothetical protein